MLTAKIDTRWIQVPICRDTGKISASAHWPLSLCAVIGLPAAVAVGEENQDGAVGTLVSFGERVMFKGEVAEPGFGHFSKYRPKFYQAVLALSGVALRRGTINVRINGEMPHFPLPNTQRIPGQDQIDFDHNQDILITPCVMEGRPGFWILPVFKGTWNPNPAGHFPKQIIEISLLEEFPNIIPGLTVSLEIPGTPLP